MASRFSPSGFQVLALALLLVLSAVGPLDLHHVGAERAQDLGAGGAGERAGEVEHANPSERLEAHRRIISIVGAVSGIPVTGVNELVLEVLDLDAAAHFYAGVLGLPVVSRSENRAWLMAGDRTRIGLWTPQVGIAQGRGGVHVHYALHIAASGFDAAVERLREHGYTLEVVEFEETDSRAAYVTDPDGNVVELWTYDVARHLER